MRVELVDEPVPSPPGDRDGSSTDQGQPCEGTPRRRPHFLLAHCLPLARKALGPHQPARVPMVRARAASGGRPPQIPTYRVGYLPERMTRAAFTGRWKTTDRCRSSSSITRSGRSVSSSTENRSTVTWSGSCASRRSAGRSHRTCPRPRTRTRHRGTGRPGTRNTRLRQRCACRRS